MAALELALESGSVRRLPGVPSGHATGAELVWHDTGEAELARAGLSLCKSAGGWRLERLVLPGPGQPAALLAEASMPEALGHALPAGLAEVARLRVRRRRLRVGEATLDVAAGPAMARLLLEGPAPALAALAGQLASTLPVSVPRLSLAAEQAGLGAGPPAAIASGQTVADALAAIVAGLHDALLRWHGLVDGASPQPVHQMRVATRRLRSALTVFKPRAGCPELDALTAGLHDCASRLGAARDWDVFLEGAAARLAAEFPDDSSVTSLRRGAARRREECYGELRAYLGGAGFRGVSVELAAFAALRPWVAPARVAVETGAAVETGPEAPAGVAEAIETFAAEALARRARKVRKAGRGIDGLAVPALHELRKDCKKLRYAADFFASLFPDRAARRYVKRLAALQEALGTLNDDAAIPGLLAQLGRADRSFAGGLLRGFAAAQSASARDEIGRAFRRFRKAEPFWPR